MIRVHLGTDRNGAIEQSADEMLTLDVPDRVCFGDGPTLQNMPGLIERAGLAQNHAVLTDPVEDSKALQDAQGIGLDEDAGADLAHDWAALEHIDRPAGPRQRNGRTQTRNAAAANNGFPHEAPETPADFVPMLLPDSLQRSRWPASSR